MKRSQRLRRGARDDGSRGGEERAGLEVEQLRHRFEKFRREHLRRTRIPEVLRAAALAAVDQGASELQVRRACKATSIQLAQWRKELRTARVFRVVDADQVVDAEPGHGMASSAEAASPELELRVGGWAIRICQLEA